MDGTLRQRTERDTQSVTKKNWGILAGLEQKQNI